MIKKILLTLFLIMFLSLPMAAQVFVDIVGNDATFLWDPAPGTVTYEIYRSDYPVTSPQDSATHEFLGEVAVTTYTVTFLNEGQFAVGVRTKKIDFDGIAWFSAITWCHIEGVPSPFVLRKFELPEAIENLRLQ